MHTADIYLFSKQIFSFYSHKSHEIYYACTNITVRSIIIARDVPFYTVILLIVFFAQRGVYENIQCMQTYSNDGGLYNLTHGILFTDNANVFIRYLTVWW